MYNAISLSLDQDKMCLLPTTTFLGDMWVQEVVVITCSLRHSTVTIGDMLMCRWSWLKIAGVSIKHIVFVCITLYKY